MAIAIESPKGTSSESLHSTGGLIPEPTVDAASGREDPRCRLNYAGDLSQIPLILDICQSADFKMLSVKEVTVALILDIS